MRMSNMFSRTLREAPNGADSKGYEYLLRAGFIRQMGAGIFSLLPLGFRATRKIEAIIREEMERIGAEELLMQTTLPVKEIAFRLGYQKPLYFSAEFRRLRGISPGNFRNDRR